MQNISKLALVVLALTGVPSAFAQHATAAGTYSNITRFHNGRLEVLMAFGGQVNNENRFGNCGIVKAVRVTKDKVDSQTWERTLEEIVGHTGEQTFVESVDRNPEGVKCAVLSLANKSSGFPNAEQLLAMKTAQSLLTYGLQFGKDLGLYTGKVNDGESRAQGREIEFFAVVDYVNREFLAIGDGLCE